MLTASWRTWVVYCWMVGVMLACSVVSSANEAKSAPAGRCSSQSFTYMRKRVGPRILPWGTQA